MTTDSPGSSQWSILSDYLNPTTIPIFFKPVKKLFDMNDVAISWKRIYATYPELDNIHGSSGWTRAEIAAMLKHTRNTQDRAIILMLASSGVRSGALPDLDWGDLAPVYRVDGRLTLDYSEEDGKLICAALEVYRGSPESYNAFITPEAFVALREYGRRWSKAMGRQADSKDPMFITTRGVTKRAAHKTIKGWVDDVVMKSGLHDGGKDSKRYRVPLMNGFRRFYNKTCKEAMSGDSTLGSLIKKEYMMGHRGLTSLDENYFKTDVLELAAEYVAAVPDLTIDDSDRLRLSNRRMADNVRRMEGEKDGEMVKMQDVVARLEAKISAMERAAREKDEEVARLARERDELAARAGGEKDEEVARLREEVAEIKRRRGMPAEELLAILRGSSKTDGMTKKLVEPLTEMVRQLGVAQAVTLKENNDRHNAKINKMLRAMERMAKEGNLPYDPLAEFEDDDEDGLPDTNPLCKEPRDLGLC